MPDVVVGGNETTRHLMSGAAFALAMHPDQRALLAESPELLPVAIEEFLRWVTPVRHVCRTTNRPIEIQGQKIQAGEYVMALLGSANRDEQVWEDAAVFDVTRPVHPMHLAFTYGTHMCLGQHVTRLETRIVFEELLRRFPNYAITGEVRRRPMILLNGIEELPIRFAA
jgi:cytochrome P450 family 142 subfamily A polypeptide 1